jgi:hypothetical protein
MAEWSQEDDEQLRALAKLALSSAQIAEQMRRPTASVRTRAAKLGIAIARENAKRRLQLNLARRNRNQTGLE